MNRLPQTSEEENRIFREGSTSDLAEFYREWFETRCKEIFQKSGKLKIYDRDGVPIEPGPETTQVPATEVRDKMKFLEAKMNRDYLLDLADEAAQYIKELNREYPTDKPEVINAGLHVWCEWVESLFVYFLRAAIFYEAELEQKKFNALREPVNVFDPKNEPAKKVVTAIKTKKDAKDAAQARVVQARKQAAATPKKAADQRADKAETIRKEERKQKANEARVAEPKEEKEPVKSYKPPPPELMVQLTKEQVEEAVRIANASDDAHSTSSPLEKTSPKHPEWPSLSSLEEAKKWYIMMKADETMYDRYGGRGKGVKRGRPTEIKKIDRSSDWAARDQINNKMYKCIYSWRKAWRKVVKDYEESGNSQLKEEFQQMYETQLTGDKGFGQTLEWFDMWWTEEYDPNKARQSRTDDKGAVAERAEKMDDLELGQILLRYHEHMVNTLERTPARE